MTKHLLGPLLLCGVLAGCTLPTGCPDDLRQRLDPQSATLAVGQEVRPTVVFLGCAGRTPLDDEVTWSSADPAVASVEPATGRITGRSPGTTVVTPRGARNGVVQHVTVTVQ